MKTDISTQLRNYGEYLDSAARHVDVERLEELADRAVLQPLRPRRHRRGWTVAAATAVVTLLIIGSVAVLQSGGSEPRAEPGSLPGFDLSDVPAFVATVAYRTPRGDALFEISYEGSSGGFRMEVVDLVSSDPTFGVRGGQGSYYVWDGDNGGAWFSVGETTVYPVTFSDSMEHALDGLTALTWPTGQWLQRCGEGINELAAEHQPLPPAVVAGRDALHMRCILLDSTWELWIDSETGVLLRVVGPLGNSRGDFPRWADDYLFDEDEGAYLALPVEAATIEVVDISYDPAFGSDVFELTTPAGWSDPGAAERSEFGSIPPFYAKVSTSLSLPELEVTMVYEIWYRGEAGWRLTSLERQGSGEFIPPGGFEVWTGNQLGEYNPDTNLMSTGPRYHEPLGDLELAAVTWDDFAEDCQPLGTAQYIGRTVTRHACVDDELWYDQPSGLMLRRLGGNTTHEILELQLNPEFPEGIFVFDPPPTAADRDAFQGTGFEHPLVGQPAPPLVGELLSGGTFDLANPAGRPTIVTFWYSVCGPCLDHLDVLHEVATQHADIVIGVPPSGRTPLLCGQGFGGVTVVVLPFDRR